LENPAKLDAGKIAKYLKRHGWTKENVGKAVTAITALQKKALQKIRDSAS